VYSFASAHFEIGDEIPVSGLAGSMSSTTSAVIPGGRPPKGVVGWLSDDSLAVIGAGRDGRWEKFVLVEGDDGKRICVRQGWKRYLGSA
jgi:WD repeat-containing protein 45